MSTRILVATALLVARAAAADPAPPAVLPAQTPSLLVGFGALASPAAAGAAFTLGLRYAPLPHLALALDLGYGLVGDGATVQDRWWIFPGIAVVGALGPLSLDVGAGIGLGAASGYRSATDYAAAPFDPTWAFQLVPAARVYATVSLAVGRRVDLFARVDGAGLLLEGNSIGSREGNERAGIGDTTWAGVTLGVQVRMGR